MTVTRSNVLALAILGVAAALRLYDLTNAQFRHDDEAMLYAASHVLETWRLPIAGMESSVGIPNGPTAVYAWLPPMALGGDMVSATVYVALLNVVTIGLTFICTRRFFGTRVALVAALLFALNPWAVIYSRRMWLNAAIPLLAVLLFWSTLALINAARAPRTDDPANASKLARQAPLAGLLLSGLVQTHLSGIAHVGTAIVVVYLARLWTTHGAALRIAGLAFLLTVAPYFVGVVAPRTARVFLDVISQSGTTTTTASEQHVPALAVLELLTSHGYQAYATHAAEVLDARGRAFMLVDALLIGMFIVGVGTLVRRAWASSDAASTIDWLPIVWIAVPCIALALLAGAHLVGEVFPFYFLVTFPALFIVVAEGWNTLWSMAERWGRWFATVPAIALLLAVCAHTAAAGAFLTSIREYRPEADYGLSLAQTRTLVELIATKAESSPIVMMGHTDIGEVVYRLLQKEGRGVSYFDDRTVLPRAHAPEALYVTLGNEQRDAWNEFPRHERRIETWSFTAHGDKWSAQLALIEQLPVEAEWNATDGLERRDATIGQLAVLHSGRVGSTAAPEQTLVAHVRWRFAAAPPDLLVAQFFLQNFSARHLVHEASFFPVDLWREEDGVALMNADLHQRVVFRVPRGIAPGDYTLSMGFARRWGSRPLEGSAIIGQVRVG